jgi:hypothetical protein
MWLTTQTENDIYEFLKDHEDDIAWGINDFDRLREFFTEVIGREPAKDADKTN